MSQISYHQNKNNNIKLNFKGKILAYINYYFFPKKSPNKLVPNPKYILEIINLSKKYKPLSPYIINNLNFKVKKGEFHAFIGGNGAGKTTTIKSIVGAYAKYEGTIFIGGYPNTSKESKKHMGYIPEIARFPDGISAKNYLISMCEMSGLSHAESVKYTIQKLKEFNMIKLAKKSPNNFSSGQKKKILLAQALVHNPEILIMDEPAANLDPISRIEFFSLLKELQLQGKAIFISSHILTELDKFADSCTVLDGGKIVYTGKINNDNSNEYVINALINQNELDKFAFENNLTVIGKKSDSKYIVKINSQSEYKLLKLMIEQNIIDEFYKKRNSLEDIYNKYVIKGSIETMK